MHLDIKMLFYYTVITETFQPLIWPFWGWWEEEY